MFLPKVVRNLVDDERAVVAVCRNDQVGPPVVVDVTDLHVEHATYRVVDHSRLDLEQIHTSLTL